MRYCSGRFSWRTPTTNCRRGSSELPAARLGERGRDPLAAATPTAANPLVTDTTFACRPGPRTRTAAATVVVAVITTTDGTTKNKGRLAVEKTAREKSHVRIKSDTRGNRFWRSTLYSPVATADDNVQTHITR